MYILGQSLHDKIQSAIARVRNSLPELEFNEFIAIPAYGTNVILRFEYIGKEPLSLESLDELESRLRERVGEDFIANLMGDVSRQCGVDFSRLNEILIRIDESSSASIRTCEAHSDGLTSDCADIRRLFGLPDRFPIWEIQDNPGGLLILALHAPDEQPPFIDRESTLDGHPVRVRFLPDDGSFRSLKKATSLAHENGTSITSVLLDYSGNP